MHRTRRTSALLATPLVVGLWSGQSFAQAPDEANRLKDSASSPLEARNADFYIMANGLATGRYEAFDAIVVDPDGNTYDPDAAINTQLRLGAEAGFNLHKAFKLKAVYEHDVYTGVASGGETDLEATGLPNDEQQPDDELRKAYGELTTPWARVTAGFQTSHWGLGLLSNDGAHGWTPGSAYFGDPRSGDRVLRYALGTGLPDDILPLKVFFAYDEVQDDDILVGDDEANQFVVAVKYDDQFGKGPNPTRLEMGAYAAFREQTAIDEQVTDVTAVDVFLRYRTRLDDVQIDTAFEGVYITGETEWAPTVNRQTHDVRQAGGLLRLNLSWGSFGVNTDMLYATGDQNFDDDQQNALKLDPNLEMGLILFRQMNAAATARAVTRASDPDLLGVPNEDLDRFPTRGSVSNTALVFPRFWWRVAKIELYGGPLVAFSEVQAADPRNTRLNGGDPQTALGGTPGVYLGTEFDLGIRYRTNIGFARMMFGLEGGYFAPGSAFTDATGGTPDPVMGGRFIGQIRL
ncbi:MAG: hypothetical protein ACE366_04035 [Bradymonadia bacterium]